MEKSNKGGFFVEEKVCNIDEREYGIIFWGKLELRICVGNVVVKIRSCVWGVLCVEVVIVRIRGVDRGIW